MRADQPYERAIDALQLLGFKTSLEVAGETVVLRWWAQGSTRWRVAEQAETLPAALAAAGDRALAWMRAVRAGSPATGVLAEEEQR